MSKVVVFTEENLPVSTYNCGTKHVAIATTFNHRNTHAKILRISTHWIITKEPRHFVATPSEQSAVKGQSAAMV